MSRSRQQLNMLGLAPAVVRSLEENCFCYTDDLKDMSPTDITQGNQEITQGIDT